MHRSATADTSGVELLRRGVNEHAFRTQRIHLHFRRMYSALRTHSHSRLLCRTVWFMCGCRRNCLLTVHTAK